jgi:hypothetical protein
MHEILGGITGPVLNRVGGLDAKGYLIAWKARARSVTVKVNAPAVGPAGSNAAPDPETVITDQAGAPVAGIPVRFTVTSGDGTVSVGSKIGKFVEVVTDPRGRASVTWTFGKTQGLNQLVAKGFGVDQTFSVTST